MDALKSKDRSLSFLVFGCGLALGFTGLYGYYRSRNVISQEMRSLSLLVQSLQREVQQLRRDSLSQSPASRPSAMSPVKRSAVRFVDDVVDRSSDIASGDEEFYDFAENDVESDERLAAAISQARALFEDPALDKGVLFNQIDALCNQFNRPAELLCLLVKASNCLVSRAAHLGDNEEKKRLAFQTLRIGEEALSKGPNSAECHKWFAIAIGGLSDFVPMKEKIQNGSRFKDHVQVAIGLAPTDATLHHMQGRFCHQIANLSWIERKVASTLFAEVPVATVADALSHFEHAHILKPEWKENVLFLAKCSIELKQMDSGRRYIEQGIAIPVRGEDDELCQKELLLLKSRHIR